MTDRYLTNKPNGHKVLKEAVTQSTGVADAGRIPATGSDGRLDTSLMPSGFGTTSKAYPASEDIGAGDLVNIFDDDGTFRIRKADASDTAKHAHGFVKTAAGMGVSTNVYFEGEVVQSVTGNISRLYLTATPGKAGVYDAENSSIMQYVGTKTSETTFNFIAEEPLEMP